VHLADCLLEALYSLAEDIPYFRAADWDRKTAAGLMIPALKPKDNAILPPTYDALWKDVSANTLYVLTDD